MSDEIGLNSNLKVGNRQLHIQTSYNSDNQLAVSCIFDAGALLDTREAPLSKDDISSSRLKREVKQFHDLVLSDIELLFDVATKVESSKQFSSVKRLGLLFLEKGFFSEAIAAFEQASELGSDKDCCNYEHGKALFYNKEYDKAIEKLEIAVDKNPEYADLQLLYGKCQWMLKNVLAGIEHIKKSFEINPDYHKAYFELGLLLLESCILDPKNKDLVPPIERIKEAVGYLQKAKSLSPDVYDIELFDKGIDLLDEKDKIQQAFDLIKGASKSTSFTSKSSIVDSEFYLQYLFAGLDKDNKSLDHYLKTMEKSISQYPDYADLHQSLGIAYMIKSWHFFIKSTDEFREALKINPDFEKASQNLKLLENDVRGFLILLRALFK